MKIKLLVKLIVVFGLLTMNSGCGNLPRGKVHGVVKYQGKELEGGTLIFICRDNSTHKVEIGKDGSYSIDKIVQGPVKVTVHQLIPRTPPRPDPVVVAGDAKVGESKDKIIVAPPSASPKLAFRLPEKYSNADQSGLQFELKSADMEWSIDLQ